MDMASIQYTFFLPWIAENASFPTGARECVVYADSVDNEPCGGWMKVELCVLLNLRMSALSC